MKKYVLLLMALFLLVLSACGSSEVETLEKEKKVDIEEERARIEEEKVKIEKEKTKIEEENVKIEKEKTKIEEEKAKIEEEKTKVAGEEQNEEINDTGTKFDDLPLAIKVHLATSIVDERAEEHDLTGFTLNYNIADDKLFAQVHSGVGVGHPVYKIQIDSDSITPIDGVVNVSAVDIEEATVNSSPISKDDLYNNYLQHKDIYESGQSNVNEVDNYIIENYESMKDEIQ